MSTEEIVEDPDGEPTEGLPELEPEDAKLITLARSARQRAYMPTSGTDLAEGAAVRDTDGRTYAAATVEAADGTSALRGAVVAAASSGARRFEAAAVVTQAGPGGPLASHADVPVLSAFGAGVPIYVAAPDGTLVAVTES